MYYDPELCFKVTQPEPHPGCGGFILELIGLVFNIAYIFIMIGLYICVFLVCAALTILLIPIMLIGILFLL